MAENTRFLTVKAVARQLACSNSYIYKLLSTGKLPHLKSGRFYRIAESALEEWIAAHKKD